MWYLSYFRKEIGAIFKTHFFIPATNQFRPFTFSRAEVAYLKNNSRN